MAKWHPIRWLGQQEEHRQFACGWLIPQYPHKRGHVGEGMTVHEDHVKSNAREQGGTLARQGNTPGAIARAG
jgi:hypothetical protein